MSEQTERCPRCEAYVFVTVVQHPDGDRDVFCAVCGLPLLYVRGGQVYGQVY